MDTGYLHVVVQHTKPSVRGLEEDEIRVDRFVSVMKSRKEVY